MRWLLFLALGYLLVGLSVGVWFAGCCLLSPPDRKFTRKTELAFAAWLVVLWLPLLWICPPGTWKSQKNESV